MSLPDLGVGDALGGAAEAAGDAVGEAADAAGDACESCVSCCGILDDV
jgi:hypothetical protein